MILSGIYGKQIVPKVMKSYVVRGFKLAPRQYKSPKGFKMCPEGKFYLI